MSPPRCACFQFAVTYEIIVLMTDSSSVDYFLYLAVSHFLWEHREDKCDTTCYTHTLLHTMQLRKFGGGEMKAYDILHKYCLQSLMFLLTHSVKVL